jgi:hypothetical protein
MTAECEAAILSSRAAVPHWANTCGHLDSTAAPWLVGDGLAGAVVILLMSRVRSTRHVESHVVPAGEAMGSDDKA